MNASLRTSLSCLALLACSASRATPAEPAGPVAPAAPAACPQAAEQLPELLASSMQRIGSEGEVRAEFEVDAQGRVQPLWVEGHRRYRSPVRTALYSMECKGGTPQRYVLNIRFADPAPAGLAKTAAPVVAVSESR
jgi:hypothetical protein